MMKLLIVFFFILLPSSLSAQEFFSYQFASESPTHKFIQEQIRRVLVVQEAFKRSSGSYGSWEHAGGTLGPNAISPDVKVLVVPAPNYRFGFKVSVFHPKSGLACSRLYGASGIRSAPKTIVYPENVVCAKEKYEDAISSRKNLSDDTSPKVPEYIKNRVYKAYPVVVSPNSPAHPFPSPDEKKKSSGKGH